jgi:hypothetical protein
MEPEIGHMGSRETGEDRSLHLFFRKPGSVKK